MIGVARLAFRSIDRIDRLSTSNACRFFGRLFEGHFDDGIGAGDGPDPSKADIFRLSLFVLETSKDNFPFSTSNRVLFN